jgi:TolB protein
MAMTRRIPLIELGALTRRAVMTSIGFASAMQGVAAGPASAIMRDYPVLRYNQSVWIALPDFLADSLADAEAAHGILQMIAGNLLRSKQFTLIDPAAFIEKIENIDVAPRFSDWRAINAQVLLTGRVTHTPDNRMKVQCQLWDVLENKHLMGEIFYGKPDDFRRVANMMSDVIYERLTGEKGNFDASASP